MQINISENANKPRQINLYNSFIHVNTLYFNKLFLEIYTCYYNFLICLTEFVVFENSIT